jgi:hypothetical protein
LENEIAESGNKNTEHQMGADTARTNAETSEEEMPFLWCVSVKPRFVSVHLMFSVGLIVA